MVEIYQNLSKIAIIIVENTVEHFFIEDVVMRKALMMCDVTQL